MQSLKNPQQRQHDWKGKQGILRIKNSSRFTKRAPTNLKMERDEVSFSTWCSSLHVWLAPNILSCQPQCQQESDKHTDRSTPQMGAKRCGPVVNFILSRPTLLSGCEGGRWWIICREVREDYDISVLSLIQQEQ